MGNTTLRATSASLNLADWCSLNTRADLMELQLKDAKMKPWRTYAEPGKC
jgi:hypothetical protein